MNQRSITVRVPASSANLGPGFDAVGLALALYADITLTIGGTAARRRPDPLRRMIATAVRAACKLAEQRPPSGLQIQVDSEIPLGRGLGASAAARAAALLGANRLLGGLLTDTELLDLGAELEGHADNIAPALFGGLQVVVWDGGTVTRVAAPLPPGLRCAGFTPSFSMPTQESRALLPKRLPRADAVHASSHAALLVAALCAGAWDALHTATEDRLHQTARSQLFPQMESLFRAANDAGAYAAYLSGGGSTVMAFTEPTRADAVAAALAAAAASHHIDGHPFVVDPSPHGARIQADDGGGDDGP